MAETDKHLRLMLHCIDVLTVYYTARPHVYVAGNNFLYWEEGNPKARISPDCYVVFGPEMRLRDNYKSWEEGDRLPAVVFEFTSKHTQAEDVRKKRPLYELVLRVPEYFQFDPTGDYLRPTLQGFRLNAGGRYEPIPLRGDRLYSEELELELVALGETMRLYNPRKGEFLPTLLEQTQRADAEAERADAEERRADAEAERADAEERRADAEANARAVLERRLLESETLRAEAQKQQVEAETRRANAAEAEAERLRAELEALRRQQG